MRPADLGAAAVARCWSLIFGAKHDLVLARAAIKSPRRQAPTAKQGDIYK